MLKISNDKWFDLNYLGLLLIPFMMILTLLFNLEVTMIFILELLFLLVGIFLHRQIQHNKYFDLILKLDNQWFIQYNNEMVPVVLKDYWLHTGRLFIWLKGSKNSVSLMLSRSIIGDETFSQLRSKIL